MLIERRDKYECRRLIIALQEPPGDLEAGEAGHLDVEEDEVGFVPFDGRNRLEAVACLRDHLLGPELFELKTELLARELLVVYYYYAH